jgi:D-alanyl-D-alanine carboxypeptidase
MKMYYIYIYINKNSIQYKIKLKGFSKEMFWENTNRLLYRGFSGIKTGITNKAGPCVVEQYQDEKINIIIVLLNCRSMDERWCDAVKIVNWIKDEENQKEK